jgi:hypothetical protein
MFKGCICHLTCIVLKCIYMAMSFSIKSNFPIPIIRSFHLCRKTLRILKYCITFNVINSCFCIFYTDLTIWILHLHPPHMCVCPQSGPEILMLYGLVHFYVQWYWCEMSLLIFVELFTITVYISLSDSCIITW